MWNQVVWEIAPLDRDCVAGLDFAYSLPKKVPDPGNQTILDIDQLENPEARFAESAYAVEDQLISDFCSWSLFSTNPWCANSCN